LTATREEDTFEQPEKLKAVCDFINDLIGDTDVFAVPGDKIILWKRRFPGHGEYEISRNEAYMRLVRASHNPKKMIEFARTNYA
jgi:hypothetical protein